MRSARTVPFISGSARSLNAEMNANLILDILYPLKPLQPFNRGALPKGSVQASTPDQGGSRLSFLSRPRARMKDRVELLEPNVTREVVIDTRGSAAIGN